MVYSEVAAKVSAAKLKLVKQAAIEMLTNPKGEQPAGFAAGRLTMTFGVQMLSACRDPRWWASWPAMKRQPSCRLLSGAKLVWLLVGLAVHCWWRAAANS